MKYTAKVEMFATESPSYVRTIVFDAEDETALDEKLMSYVNGYDEGICVDNGITVDDTYKPPHFDESGGFSCMLLEFYDDTGKDFMRSKKWAF